MKKRHKVKVKIYIRIRGMIWLSGVKCKPFSPVYWILNSELDTFLIRWCASFSMVLPSLLSIFRRHMEMAEINMYPYTGSGQTPEFIEYKNSATQFHQKLHPTKTQAYFVGTIKNWSDCKEKKKSPTTKNDPYTKSLQVKLDSDFLINGLCN